ncbi:hypothetical protein [Thioalkalivibrio sp. ALE23]|uniref:hypothetical protein n=1 Tax=Thioalkalivibrio sp. ALE23 TaxID=1265495 RepID=UPI00036FFDF8|nr:hypothetical protein [Thioalkalivibrio sp. ALE23]
MSYALIDNASLTAVQRAMGDVVVRTPDTVNGDIAALESFVQAILFYDDLVCLDNYKEEHREEREARFHFVRFIDPKNFKLEGVEDKAAREAANIRPEIRGGEFVNEDFRELLHQLKMNMVCTWDLRSSVYYLTMKMLGQPNTEEYAKYSELSAAIFNELADAGDTRGRWSTGVELYSSAGKRHTLAEMVNAAKEANRGLGGTTRALEMFIASLNWLSYKTIYYSLLARTLHADTFLHPIRHAYQLHWMKKSGAYGHDFTEKLVGTLQEDIKGSVSAIVDEGRTAAVAFDVPVFSAYLVQQAGDVRGVVDAALELKRTSDFEEIRGMLREIRNAFDEDGLKEANRAIQKWKRELEKASGHLRQAYGVETAQGISVSKIARVYNAVATVAELPNVPEVDTQLPWPDFLRWRRDSGFTNIYKDIAQELTSVDRLGGLRDLLAAGFEIDEEHYLPPKTEDPRFRQIASDWKLPM